jgi:hypothetical protein
MRGQNTCLGSALLCTALFLPLSAFGQEAEFADFSGYWGRTEDTAGRMFHPPASGPGPVMDVPEAGDFRIGDHTNPILLPHAAAAVKAFGDRGRAGEVVLPAWSLCQHSGVPLALNMGEPVQILQDEDQVTILYQRDMQVRRIDINAAQPAAEKHSWYGHSVGHYEGPNTLVVDTRWQNDEAIVDRHGTPRSDKMRVVERYTINEAHDELHVAFTVEDPGTFTMPWSGNVTYYPTLGETEHFIFGERICAENNKDPDGGLFDIPLDTTPDF